MNLLLTDSEDEASDNKGTNLVSAYNHETRNERKANILQPGSRSPESEEDLFSCLFPTAKGLEGVSNPMSIPRPKTEIEASPENIAKRVASRTSKPEPLYISPFKQLNATPIGKKRYPDKSKNSRFRSLCYPNDEKSADEAEKDVWMSNAKEMHTEIDREDDESLDSRSTEVEIHEDDKEQIWPKLATTKEFHDEPLLLSELGREPIIKVCARMNAYLYDYQRDGIRFLYKSYSKKTGAILGNDMGLGKTIQIIGLLSAIFCKEGDIRDRKMVQMKEQQSGHKSSSLQIETSPVLIVVPASLVYNWESELHVWMCCSVGILSGNRSQRELVLDRIAAFEYEVVVCSYDMFKLYCDNLQQRAKWGCVILDEMHCLKNPESKVAQAVKKFTNCRVKLGLTGTLMQNNERELFCLVDIISPGVLGTWQEFREYYGKDIKYARKRSANKQSIARSEQKKLELSRVMAPIYLRRDKQTNPYFAKISKMDRVIFCPLTPLQSEIYRSILELPEFRTLRNSEQLCDCGRASKLTRKECCHGVPKAQLDSKTDTIIEPVLWNYFHPSGIACKSCPNCMIFYCIAQLLKVSNHLELIKANIHDTESSQQLQTNLLHQLFSQCTLHTIDDIGGLEPVTQFHELEKCALSCGKLQVLDKLLHHWRKRQQKTLLFSRSTRMLDILQLFLISKGIPYLRLDGSTKLSDRLKYVKEFNSTEHSFVVFIISTRAGGLGLNLPTARNVVIFDPSWNPARDSQAQDRAYRIGQTKHVHVYRLITLGTIEEMVYVRQVYKQQLCQTTLKSSGDAQLDPLPRYFEAVQGDPKEHGKFFGIKNLLCYKEKGILRDIQIACDVDPELGYMTVENKLRSIPKDEHVDENKRRAHISKTRGGDDEMMAVAGEIVSTLLDREEVMDSCKRIKAQPKADEKIMDNDSIECFDSEASQLLEVPHTFSHTAILGKKDSKRKIKEPKMRVARKLTLKNIKDDSAENRTSSGKEVPKASKMRSLPPRDIYIPSYCRAVLPKSQ